MPYTNRADRLACQARYYARNCSRLRAAGRAYHAKHRECGILRPEEPNHPTYCRTSRLRIKQEAIAAYGGKCQCCGETQGDFLTIDHINGRQKGEFGKTYKVGGEELYRCLKKRGWPKDAFRLLCMNCNFALGKFGRCPHTPIVVGENGDGLYTKSGG